MWFITSGVEGGRPSPNDPGRGEKGKEIKGGEMKNLSVKPKYFTVIFYFIYFLYNFFSFSLSVLLDSIHHVSYIFPFFPPPSASPPLLAVLNVLQGDKWALHILHFSSSEITLELSSRGKKYFTSFDRGFSRGRNCFYITLFLFCPFISLFCHSFVIAFYF